MALLIAEIGNNHFGSINKAKELIQAAIESGANLVKGQAYTKDAITGSMPNRFYENCRLREDEYLDLMYYARSLGSDMFYSVFTGKNNDSLASLLSDQKYKKVPGFLTKTMTKMHDQLIDSSDTFISIPSDSRLPQLKYANILHVSDYMTEKPDLARIKILSEFYRRPVGYSDHTTGTKFCIEAITKYECSVLEKHFTLTHGEKWFGITFRDTLHGATPAEFKNISFANPKETQGEIH